MIEPKAGMFLGRMTARMRDRLWRKAVEGAGDSGSVVQVWTAATPQGFAFRVHGDPTRHWVDLEGLHLVAIRRPNH